MLYVGGTVLPYHLAIGSQWKVHHFSTDMANHAWMQQEEEMFLANPETVFGPAQMATLQNIGKATGLDFVGIDCALNQAGEVMLFEANAAMLVSGSNNAFPYKTPYVRKIKETFDLMLGHKAGVV